MIYDKGPRGDQREREKTKMERDAKKWLQLAGATEGSTQMAEKLAPGTSGDRIDNVQTNLHGLVMTKKLYVYRYALEVTAHTGRGVVLSNRVPGDVMMIDRREKCSTIFRVLTEQRPEFFRHGPYAVYYDQQAILFTISKFKMDSDWMTFEITQGLPDNWKFNACSVKISALEGGVGRLILGEFLNDGNAVQNLTIEQFLGIATNQSIIFNPSHVIFSSLGAQRGSSTEIQIYLTDPQQYGFQREEYPDLADGVCLRVGCTKAPRYIEGPGGYGSKTSAVLVQTKKSPFYKSEPVIEFVKRILGRRYQPDYYVPETDLNELDIGLEGLCVDTFYDPPYYQRFKIHRVHAQSARQKTISMQDGRQMTVQEYFKTIYGVELQYPDANLLVRDGREERYYPMEMVKLSENQKVRMQHQQQLGIDKRTMVQRCSMQPDVLKFSNRRMVNSFALEDNPYLNNAGLRFFPEFMEVNARLLTPPSIQYASGLIANVEASRGYTWRSNRFLIPMSCERWAAFCPVVQERGPQQSGGGIAKQEFVRFVMDHYMRMMQPKGMTFQPPLEIATYQSSVDSVRDILENAQRNGLQFVLLAHLDDADEIHHSLKFRERERDVITQGLKVGTIQRVLTKPQPQTVENIVQKTNMKLGGLNYSLTLDSEWTSDVVDKNTLFIGFGVNHPSGGLGKIIEGDGTASSDLSGGVNGNGHISGYTNGNGHRNGNGEVGEVVNGNKANRHDGSGSGNNEPNLKPIPSVIGFSANIGKHPFEFIGDFIYHAPQRDEKADVIRDVVKRCVDEYVKNRGATPARVVIYRNGCGEGQFQDILRFEVPLIKKVLAEKSKLTLIISNKIQKVRLLKTNIDPKAKPADKNVQPGTVVDTGAVHPSFTEFFVVSARALQGTARCPKYTLLYDESKMTLDKLENITYRLAYGHQIVCLPTSLPTPVFVAEEYAKRGRNLYRQYIDEHSGPKGDHVERNKRMRMSYKKLTAILAFGASGVLGSRRINA